MKIEEIHGSKTPSFKINEGSAQITEAHIVYLRDVCRERKVTRSRICLHDSNDKNLQIMLIVMLKEDKIAPHSQNADYKIFNIVSGRALVEIYESDEVMKKKYELAAPSMQVLRINPREYHKVIPLDEYIAFVEIIPGSMASLETHYL